MKKGIIFLIFLILIIVLPLVNAHKGSDGKWYHYTCTPQGTCIEELAAPGDIDECHLGSTTECNPCLRLNVNCNSPPLCFQSPGTCIIIDRNNYNCVYNTPSPSGTSCGNPNHVCNGGGTCMCRPSSCEDLGKYCGTWQDGCGSPITCNRACQSHYICQPSSGNCICLPDTCSSLGKNCNNWSDGCGNIIDCGPPSCSIGHTCENGICTYKVYWANMKKQKINKTQVQDSVLMIIENALSFPPGTELNFTIKELDSNQWVRDYSNPIKGVVDNNGNALATWIITKIDFQSTPLHDRYVFYVQGLNSTELKINETPNNSPPISRIIKPEFDSFYKVNTSIDFIQNIEDEDDDLMAVWNFGDGNTTTFFNCLTYTNCSTTHSYINSGTKVISLYVKEIIRNLDDINYTRIFLYNEGITLQPVIDKPFPGSKFNGTRTINFLANKSFVSNCTLGFCPCNIANPCTYGITSCYNVSDLYCYDLNKSGIPNDYELWFSWIFSEGPGLYGNWSKNYFSVVNFYRSFIKPLKQSASLKLGFNQNGSSIIWSDSVNTYFEFLDKYPVCYKTASSAFWIYWNETTGEEIRIDATVKNVQNPSGCYRSNGWPSTTCCPINTGSCDLNLSSPTSLTCNGPPNPTLCREYATEDECEGFSYEVAKKSYELFTGINGICDNYYEANGTCYYFVGDCRCIWNPNAIADKCQPQASKYDMNCTGEIPGVIGNCTFLGIQEQDNCNVSNSLIFKWEENWTGNPLEKPSWCRGGERKIGCEASTKLPLFTEYNFILSLVLIAGIYFIFVKKKHYNYH